MPDLGAIHEPVRFAYGAATGLAAELRGSAGQLDDQAGARRRAAATARTEWRGVYGDQFDGRVATCTGDASRFGAAMRRAADQLDELAARARAEEQRRAQARDWQQRQEDESFMDKVGDFFGGEDDLPPPPPPDPPARFVSEAPPTPARGPESAGGGSAQ